MRIGYACQTIGVYGTNFKTCILKNANEDTLSKIIAYNLESLDKILDYNIENGIKLFRITSDLIPFGSSPANTIRWWERYQEKLTFLGRKALVQGIRLSMHPGQYTVLNSPNTEVVERAIKDLEYHNLILDSMGLDKSNKIILHIGGIYQNKEEAIQRFITTYHGLDQRLKDRIVLENDDRLYTISDVLSIAREVGAPAVFDNLHHKIHQGEERLEEAEWINLCKSTWKTEDGTQKIHYSEQNQDKKPGSHSNTINGQVFQEFCNKIDREDIDIMLEVKDKNLSTMKCMNFVCPRPAIRLLEEEWGRYKYAVLERSPADYNKIRQLLKDKKSYPVDDFYRLIDHALSIDIDTGIAINAAQHVWGYFSDHADNKEKQEFEKRCNNYLEGKLSLHALKKYLWKLSLKYQEKYLLHSNYFAEVMEV